MKKRILVLAAVLSIVCASGVFATGIGVQGSLNAGDSVNYGGAITFKIDKSPYVFAVSFHSGPYVGVTFDDWLANPTITGSWKWFYGIGGAVGVGIPSNALYVYGGFRALVGTNFYITKNFELYAQAAWQPGLSAWISGNSGVNPSIINFPADLGLRFWF